MKVGVQGRYLRSNDGRKEEVYVRYARDALVGG